ncbi:NADPH:quinone oxidoreductase family protein [Roseomonas alkaliterrae]|uniref:NADPH2:quinone reductase n=1 Tax=Neoroseomonas alkaliterrae TaxID=1452450 RepID=A0A840XTU6_9PROT|nr:NADPH:quinone oxidoreductase family protein [Neoroseomonas alkaliterrae]MBB5691306.1 NADPH2:quinone reductase [Neoroseomonas alkaliterrae]MBR0676686.1 NADPH:quinone oxidoreductase family protein [Neoroseomonas alkaliterrae]
MRAILCESWRDFDALEVKDIPPPPMRPRGVRIRVEAAGVSFATQLVVAGKYQRKPPLPFVPGTEIVGTVIEAAPDAEAPPAGTRVFAVLDWGGYAEEAIADDIHVVAIPEGLPAEAAVAFPISYPTAGAGLLWRGRIAPGDWVLVHGAAGGVGLAGVEIAKAVGCRVIARAGAAKHGLLRARRADVVLDSAEPFRDAVREATGGQGVACVLDTIGGDAFDESLRCLGDGGTLVVVGFAGGGIPTVAANILLLKNIAVAGVNWGTYVGWSPGDARRLHAPRARALWAQLMAWWQAGALRPEVHAAFPLERFREAMAEVRERRSAGRVVLRP